MLKDTGRLARPVSFCMVGSNWMVDNRVMKINASLSIVLLAFVLAQNPQLRTALIGDSTVEDKSGWGRI